MTYEFQFDRKEHVRACRAIHRRAIRRWWWRVGQVGLWAFGIMVVINIGADLLRQQFPAMLLGLAVLVSLFALPTLNGYAGARQWEKLNPPGNRRVIVGLGDDGFRTSSFAGAVEIRWEAVKQVVETPEFFLFYVTEQIAYYLPRRAAPGADVPALRDFIRSGVAAERASLLNDGSGAGKNAQHAADSAAPPSA